MNRRYVKVTSDPGHYSLSQLKQVQDAFKKVGIDQERSFSVAFHFQTQQERDDFVKALDAGRVTTHKE